jgi:ligand-binding SRPBCC domain-containing protein
MATFTITRKLDLPSEKVWATVSDFNRPPSPVIKIEVEEKGDPEANGIGAIRNIKIKGVPGVVERLETVDAPNSITYRMLSGAPVKEYLGTVNVVAQDGATVINWDVKLIPKIPGIGWLAGMVIRKAINRYIDAIEEGHK